MFNHAHLHCFEDTDIYGNKLDFGLWGSNEARVYRDISVVYRPCIPVQRTADNSATGKCLIDDINNQTQLAAMLKASQDYIGEGEFQLLYNEEIFDAKKFGVESIKKVSKFTAQ